MRAMANQVLVGGAVSVTKVKVLEPKPFCGVRDAKVLENFTFDLEQYFKATNTVTEEAKVTLVTMYLFPHLEGIRIVARVLPKLSGETNVLGPHLARECTNKVDFHAFQASLIADSDDKSNQAEDEASLIDGGEKTRMGAIKYMSSLQKKSGERHVPTKWGLLYVDTWINQKQTKSTMVDSGATHNFITEPEARRLRLRWKKDSGRMKAVNSIALPIVGLVKRTTIKLGGWKGPVDFVVVKMDDFDVVLRMEFLLEHQDIPMPSAKCLAITGSFSTVVRADIRQPNGFKMISAMQLDESHAQEEPPSVEIPLGASEKGRRQSPKTLCVSRRSAMVCCQIVGPSPHRCEGGSTMG
ncbi:gag-asp_proteas domain-containing protein [Cucumis melo var. makuwa]|uniref:Gag-asp_proteas domain-containing protein n=1 Tax=Cucumis melo var. makuwa TaxID=1194695 RepID=A0A5A7U6F2_CUCMM|nr:gag-asp_proteas domain-containing protein [Cucumis melo var. makuwa]TYK04148.1 gag-asp_proteas domain-containing protein [Cucumis melo var. makuwa]